MYTHKSKTLLNLQFGSILHTQWFITFFISTFKDLQYSFVKLHKILGAKGSSPQLLTKVSKLSFQHLPNSPSPILPQSIHCEKKVTCKALQLGF